MGRFSSGITEKQRALIEAARVFFVASAHPELEGGPDGQGPVNLSPKGNVPLHVIDEKRVAFLDYHGSGNETARHADAGGPITIMVLSFAEEDAAIVRLYGLARATPIAESDLADALLEKCRDTKGLRQVITVDVERTQTSCGYGVPVYRYVADRTPAQRGRRFKDPKAPSV